MHHRYSTRASAINQMYLRATLIEAVRDICPPPYSAGFDIEHMRDSPLYEGSMYVGPFVTYSLPSACASGSDSAPRDYSIDSLD